MVLHDLFLYAGNVEKLCSKYLLYLYFFIVIAILEINRIFPDPLPRPRQVALKTRIVCEGTADLEVRHMFRSQDGPSPAFFPDE